MEQLTAALAQQTGLPFVDLAKEPISSDLAWLLPEKAARQFHAVPLRTEGARNEVLVVAVGAPAEMNTLDGIRVASGKSRVVPFLASDDDIDRAIGAVYRDEVFERPAWDVDSSVIDAREQMFDADLKRPPRKSGARAAAAPPPKLAAIPESQAAGGLIQALRLSKACGDAVRAAARREKTSVAAVIARVLETWARKP